MPHGLIRPEAQPVSWDNLNKNQQSTITQILEVLAEAVAILPKKESSEDNLQPYLSRVKASRIAFLDGQRGTGKSTVLVTILAILGEEEFIFSSSNNQTSKTIEKIKNRIVVLEPIDMEPVPEQWNMLPAILARIEKAYSHFSKPQFTDPHNSVIPGLLDPSNHYHEAWKELTKLQNNIALSWDGNLNERAGRVDPDTYARETMRNEQARLELNPSFKKTLNLLAKQISQCSHIQDPIFLLPIDDFDLNPSACLEMLRILRMLSVPRLFTLVLGDMDVVDIVLNLKKSATLNAVFLNGNEKMLSVLPSEVSMLAGRTASHALQKLLPPVQRYKLSHLAKYEALNYQPLGLKNVNTLYENLKSCEINLGTAFLNDENSSSCVMLSDFLLTQGYSLKIKKQDIICTPSVKDDTEKNRLFSRDDINSTTYSGMDLLATTPRSAADLWTAFEKYRQLTQANESEYHIKSDENIKYAQVENIIAQLCRDQLLRDGALTSAARRITRGGFFHDFIDELDLEALPLIPRAVIDHGISISKNKIWKEDRREKCSFIVYRPIEWRFRLKNEENITTQKEGPKSEDSNTRQTKDSFEDEPHIEYMQPGKHYLSVDHLSSDTSGIMILFHDLLCIGKNYRSNGFLLPSSLNSIQNSWCKTVWTKGIAYKVELPWFPPLCRSFFGLDYFLSAWKQLLTKSIEPTVDQIAFLWITAGTAATMSQTYLSFSKSREDDSDGIDSILDYPDFPNNEDWDHLGKKLVKIITSDDKKDENKVEQIQSWLISIAIMIMPETGLPNNIAGLFKENPELIEYWISFPGVIRQHRFNRLIKIYDSGLKRLAFELYDTEIYGLEALKEKTSKENSDKELWQYFQPITFDRRGSTEDNRAGIKVGLVETPFRGSERRKNNRRIYNSKTSSK